MKTYQVYVYFPASELQINVQAESMQEACEKVELNGNKLLAKDVYWNDTNGQTRVIGCLEQLEIK